MSLPAENSDTFSGRNDVCAECEQDTFTCDNAGCFGKYNPGFRTRALMSDGEKLTAILENQVWLSNTVAGLLQQFQSNPMFRMMTRGK